MLGLLRLPLRFLFVLLLGCISASSIFMMEDPVVGLVACRASHIQALTQFKREFDSSGCNQTDYFNGIWCDNTTGVVTKLQLPSGCLSGTLYPNSSLFRLHHLRYLNLSYNDFTSSSLPIGFGNLNKLEVLSLSTNGFIGQVPSSFNNLSMLSYLVLSQNEFTGNFPPIHNLTKLSVLDINSNHFSTLVPNSSLFKLHHLRYLDLSYNNFTSSLPSGFCNLNKLETLSLFSNGFISQVPSSFSNLSQLSFLDLSQNDFTGTFPPIHNLTKLSVLEIASNHLSTLNPNSRLFGLHHLRYLDLSQNNFISSSIPFEFGNLNKLEVLSLSYNGLIGQVPSSFSNLSRLTELYLGYNKLTDYFPLVRNLTKLSILSLPNNHFSGSIPSSLFIMPFLSSLDLKENHFTAGPVEVSNSSSSSKLLSLTLGHNQFGEQILKPISKLSNLIFLDLSFLNISQPIDLNLFSFLKSLLSLDLSGNSVSPISLSLDSVIPLNLNVLHLSDCNITEFPNILKPLQNLMYLYISSNRIERKVLEWFWSLSRLITVAFNNNDLNGFQGSENILVNSSVQTLFLDSNSFEGTLPNLPLSINYFSAWRNHFTGNIPLSICNRNSLIGLDLSYNNFTGLIPHCLSNLTLLGLRKNNLEGSLPDLFYADSSLRTLDVGYNQLTEKLPKSLVNCSSLEHLSVEHNRIEDAFPFWLKALPNLQILILHSNKLYGSITPPHQGPLAFPELRIFEISNNNFSGSLPASYFLYWKASSDQMNEDESIYMKYETKGVQAARFNYEDQIDLLYKGLFMENGKVLTSYSTIDFSGNKIEGEIPESIGLLKELIALNLSNNAFTGYILVSLANLTELESLDLSRNQLSGTIPNGLKTLSFLAYVNVSHNQLKGEIPQGTQITGQPQSSFEGNAGLCGLPLEESCFRTDVSPTQQPDEEDKEEKDNEVLSWKAVVIGYGLGVLLGLAIAQVIASYRPEWLAKIVGLNKRKNR